MHTDPTVFIYPPRPDKCLPRADTEILGEMGFLAQLKYNDSRCLIKYLPDGEIQLWNRHGEKFRDYTAPDSLLAELHTVQKILGLSPTGYHLLDGGLLDRKHKAIKDSIVIWDILVRDGEHLLGTTYLDRYNSLHVSQEAWNYQHPNGSTYQLGLALTDNILIPECHSASKWPELWNMIDEINATWTIGKPTDKNYQCHPLIEGLVFKNPSGELEMGFSERNNSSWLMRSRIETGRHRF
jgi:hypothetical protein